MKPKELQQKLTAIKAENEKLKKKLKSHEVVLNEELTRMTK